VLGVSTNRTGLVDLFFFNARGAPVTYYECAGGRAYRLGVRSMADAATTPMLGATQWRCDRLSRYFAATVTLPDGSPQRGLTSVRTMSCARRFALEVPRRIAPGQEARVRVVDRWGIGAIHTRLCLTPPGGRPDCRTLAFAPAAGVAGRRFRPGIRGEWGVDLQVRRYHVRASVAVGVGSVAAKVAPTVLATGDSTMQGVDSFLADDLGDAATVVSDVHPGSGISRIDWPAFAAAQVARLRPATTVISLGAAEGLPMRSPNGSTRVCCGEEWVAEYSRRVRETMLIYRRHGRARVFYLTIAEPREAANQRVIDAVNQAIIRAGAGLAGVSVLRNDLLLSPHGYQEVIRYQGRDVDVREPDGLHLNVSGTAIEASEAAAAVRRG
jgi:hypothetical protein